MNEGLRSRVLEKFKILIQSKNLILLRNSESYCNLPVHTSLFVVHFSLLTPTLSQKYVTNKMHNFLFTYTFYFLTVTCFDLIGYFHGTTLDLVKSSPAHKFTIYFVKISYYSPHKHGWRTWSLFFTYVSCNLHLVYHFPSTQCVQHTHPTNASWFCDPTKTILYNLPWREFSFSKSYKTTYTFPLFVLSQIFNTFPQNTRYFMIC
jgi:hypothetical protein